MRKIAIILLSVIALKVGANDKLGHIQLYVTQDAAGQRQALLNEALTKVILRVSGQTSVLHSPELTNQSEAEILKLVKTYTYKFQNDKQFFDVTFDCAAVKNKLLSLGFEVLPENRPYTILWLVSAEDEQDDELAIVGSDTHTALKKILETKSLDFGLPVILPLLDFSDTMAIEVQDVLDINQGVLQAVSKKYAAQNILVGKIVLEDNLWCAQLNLLNYPDASWTITSDSLEKVAEILFNNMAIAMIHAHEESAVRPQEKAMQVNANSSKTSEAKIKKTSLPKLTKTSNNLMDDEHSAPSTSTPKPAEAATKNEPISVHKANKEFKKLSLHVSGIDDLSKYATIISYLRRIDGVNDVEVAELNEDSALFTIKSALSLKDLTGIISKDQFLTAASTVSKENEMRFILSS